jgi:LAS superfamily LD-carboxypeptidase LdcB
MKYPYKKLVLPKELTKVENGKLDVKTLVKVKCGGVMYVVAAEKFNELYDAALEAGHKLRNVGDYRSADAQLKLFKERYRLAEDRDWADKKKGILVDADRVKRSYDGQTWLLRNGFAPCSSPQKSNHGYGLAIDLGVERKGKLVALASDKEGLKWMCDNAPDFGFFLQSDDPKSREFEAWHWQYCGVGA